MNVPQLGRPVVRRETRGDLAVATAAIGDGNAIEDKFYNEPLPTVEVIDMPPNGKCNFQAAPVMSRDTTAIEGTSFRTLHSRDVLSGWPIPPGVGLDFGNHLEERLLDQAQARASFTPPFWGSFA